MSGALPWITLQKTFNPVAGSMEGLAVFLAVVLVFLTGILLAGARSAKISEEKKENSDVFWGEPFIIFFSWLLLFLSLGLLLIIDAKIAWLILVFSLVLILIFVLIIRMFKDDVNRLLLPIFLLIIAAVFLFIDLPVTRMGTLPQEPILDQQESLGVSLKAAASSPQNIFLGSGIGTFNYDFSRFKSARFNQGDFWQIRFDRPGNSFTEILATAGSLGLLSYLFLLGLFFLASWIFFRAKNQQGKLHLPFIMAFLALFAGQFVYYQNTVLMFMFWLFLGLSMVGMKKDFGELKYSFKSFPEMGLVFNVVLAVFLAGFLAIYFFAARFYFADLAYVRALKEQNREAQIKNLHEAVSLNPRQLPYLVSLSKVYLVKTLEEVNNIAESQNSIKVACDFSLAVAYAKGQNVKKMCLFEGAPPEEEITIKGVTQLYPESAAAFENLGFIYRELTPFALDANKWAIDAFLKTAELEPTNTVIRIELAKLLVIAERTEEAKKEFEKAFELKPDYPDPEAFFQLGRLYYNGKQIDEAILKFQQAILLSPNYANAHYALGLAYIQRGKKELAIAEFEKVLTFNPDNQDVIDKIEELRK